MSVVGSPINANLPVDLAAAHLDFVASNLPDPGPTAGIHQPGEHTGVQVVMEKLAQTLRGKIRGSHKALQLLIGQRPAGVSSTCGLRYFTGARRSCGMAITSCR